MVHSSLVWALQLALVRPRDETFKRHDLDSISPYNESM